MFIQHRLTKKLRAAGSPPRAPTPQDNGSSDTESMSDATVANLETCIDTFNATDDSTTLGHSLPSLLRDASLQRSERAAIVCGEDELSYGDLNLKVNALARVLSTRGIAHGDLVGIALERSIAMVVALLAVLKTGAAYLPMDPSFPKDRIGHILEDAKPKIVVVGNKTRAVSEAWKCVRLDLDQDEMGANLDSPESETDEQNWQISPQDLAYVIYTSGSTGKPKGVEISHDALCNFLLGMQKVPGCHEAVRLLAITTISFDIAALELFLPLLSGGTVVLATSHEAKHPETILELISRHKVTMMQATPATWQMLLDADWEGEPHLGKILCGGDVLPRRLAQRLLQCADSVWNCYGPTEATVWASIWRVSKDEDVVIGQPINNYKLYVLDADHVPVPPGGNGELYIGGKSLGQYRNKPELTRSRFIDNPFHGGLMYRTGDWARYDHRGITVLGRTDGQVKIRGHRIELGDIAAILAEHEDVSDVVVVGKDGRLIAYYIPVSGTLDKTSMPDNTLRSWLDDRLPAYMVPSFFVKINAFPMTLNNKVDRNALPEPTHAVQPVLDRVVTKIESIVRLIWSEVLGREPDQIGLSDNFFEIGGDSVRVVQVQRRLEKHFKRRITSAQMFKHFTLETLAAYFDGETSSGKVGPSKDVPRRVPRKDEDIAVVGMSCRLPGNVSTPEEYWHVLNSGADVTSDIPMSRWDADAIYCDSEEADGRGKSYCRRGGFLASVDDFDASFFNISPREAVAMDPAQRIMLETSWESFERAGYTTERMRGSQTGVYIGVCTISAHTNAPNLEDLDGYNVTGTAGGTISGRISYTLGLEGPSMTIDTACASSLVTTQLAINALRMGECDIALSGGVSLLLNPGMHIEFTANRGMSKDGRCRAFAEDTGGTGWAEGCTAVVLKRVSDAIRDGDYIHALLKGSAVNHVGRSAAGLAVPSATAQSRLIRTALSNANLHPGDIDYVEAHGTGTRLGDPIEGASLAAVFGGRQQGTGLENESEHIPLYIGSVKSQLGHTQAAAGLAGLIKTILAINNSRIPQTLYAETPTREIEWESANMLLVQQSLQWPRKIGRLRRAGVSAFGIGGTNAHVIVEEFSTPTNADASSSKLRSDILPLSDVPFLLSAKSDRALAQQAEKLLLHLETSREVDQEYLRDIAYSLATRRTHFQKRIVLTASDEATLKGKLRSVPDLMVARDNIGNKPRLAILFTGQGSQVLGMGQNLYQAYPAYRHAMDEILSHFTALNGDISLRDVLESSPGSDKALLLHRTDFAQPALFAVEVALWHLWTSFGVQPKLLLGHSVGELSAAYVAGVWSLSDACRIVAARGRLMQSVSASGSMVSIEASVDDVATAIRETGVSGEVDVAGHNTPNQTVASGNKDAIEKLISHFASSGPAIKTKYLKVSHAFHSHHMDIILSEFRSVLETVRFDPPQSAIVSTLTGELAVASELGRPDYWVAQARRAVHFAEGIEKLHQLGANIYLELGPQAILTGMGALCLSMDESLGWLPSLRFGRHDTSVIQHSLTELHTRGLSINWAGYFDPLGPSRRVELPTYAFQRQYFTPLRKYKNTATASSSHVNRIIAEDDANAPARSRHLECVTDQFAFEVSWLPPNQESRSREFAAATHGSWGLLYPGNYATTSWVTKFMLLFEQAGLQLLPVGSLEDAQSLQIDGLLCLWDSVMGDAHADVPKQAHDLVCSGLSLLQRAVAQQFTPRIVWVTQQSIGAGAEDNLVTGLTASPLWGLMRTARNEHPELNLRLVDIDNDSLDDTHTLIPLLRLVLSLEDEPECALRQGRVLVPRLRPRVPKPGSTPSKILEDGAVLITGGLGDLGSRVARWLLKVHKVRDIVLTSRRGTNASNAHRIMDEFTALGARVNIMECEMDNKESVKSVLAKFDPILRPLRGVIHAAGAQDNGILTSLTPQRCATTFAPKVDGAWHLHQLTQHFELEFFVMFSSISGVMGMEGHGNYAAANTFLDALAQLRQAQGLRASSVAFGTWQGDGMASKIKKTTLARLVQSGLDMLTPELGLELLSQAMTTNATLTVAAALDLHRLQNYHNDRGQIPALLRMLLNQVAPKTTAHDLDFRQTLAQAKSGERPQVVLTMVQATVARTLGFALARDVDIEASLQDIGIDSLTAVLIRNQLVKVTGLQLSARFAFQHLNLKSLSEHLVSELADEDDSDYSLDSATPNTTPSSSQLWLDMQSVRKGCLDISFDFDNTKSIAKVPKNIFITGATGFVGAFVLYEMLMLGKDVYCLVRADDTHEAFKRLTSTLSGYGLWNAECISLLHPIIGDMALPLFGLSEREFGHLADTIDTICHAAAFVNWMRPLEEYVGPNIVSSHEMLRLASRGKGKKVHLISTMSTIPKYLGHDLKEDDPEFGYATSKYLSERMVVAARWRGARVSIYRLPFVSASGTGHFRLDKSDFLHNFLAGCLEMGIFPSVDADMSAVLPVDYIARTVAAIMVKEEHRIGQDYNFTNGNAFSFNSYFKMMSSASLSAKVIPFLEWRTHAFQYAAADLSSPVARIIPLLDGVTDDKGAAMMLSGWPVIEPILGAHDFIAPCLTEQSVHNYANRIKASQDSP